MSTLPASTPAMPSAEPRGRHTFRWDAPAVWASIAISAMWLAVLFVGLWGGDIYSSSAGGNMSKVPSVVAVAALALGGTWALAKRAFGASPDDLATLRAELAAERAAREALAQQVAALTASRQP